MLLILAASSAQAAINVNLGGGTGVNDAKNKANWYTNNNLATNGGAGLAYSWENVTQNSASVYYGGTSTYHWSLSAGTTQNFVIGHGFLFNETFDLSGTADGIQDLSITTRLTGNQTMRNWRLLMVVDNQQYQYHGSGTGNYFSGTSETTFSNLKDNTKWVKINNTGIVSIEDTHGGAMTTNLLQGTSGIVQFGYMAWNASSSSSMGSGGIYNLGPAKFEVDIAYNAVPEPATFALLLGAAGLCFVMIRRRRT